MTAPLNRSLRSKRLWMMLAAVLSVALSAAHVLTAQRRDDLPKYAFTVEIEGVSVGALREVGGISVETEVVEFREGGSTVVRKLPGPTKYPNIVLKRGYTGNTDFYDWATTRTGTGDVVRRSVSIIMTDQSGAQVARWNVQRAWAVKWQGPTLNASGNDVAIETLELAHEGLTLSRDE